MGRVMNPNPTRYDLTIGERGAMRLPRQEEGMTYHHIIPFPVLRTFWNTAVACDLETLRETLVPALNRSMETYALERKPPAPPGTTHSERVPLSQEYLDGQLRARAAP